MLEFVEHDSPIAAADVPWHLDRVDQRAGDLDGSYGGDPDGGRGVHVYVLDSGIRASHAEFEGRVVPAWDIGEGGMTNCSDSVGPCAEDDNGHGTHVAGLVGGSTYGIAKGSTLHSVKILDRNGIGAASWFAHGLDLVVAFGQRPAVVVASLAGEGNLAAMNAFVVNTVAAGITVVVAAGNYNADACGFSPARVPTAITVGASAAPDRRASFSNSGPCVDIFAPGADILSAMHWGDSAVGWKDGTSQAAPLVAGAAALLLSGQPLLTPGDVAARLQLAATPGALADVDEASTNLMLFVPPAAGDAYLDLSSPGSGGYIKLPAARGARALSIRFAPSRVAGQDEQEYVVDARGGLEDGWFRFGRFDGLELGSGWASLYIDGVESSNVTRVTRNLSWMHVYLEATGPFSDDINIFSSFADDQLLPAKFHCAQLWDRALSEVEISSLATGERLSEGLIIEHCAESVTPWVNQAGSNATQGAY